MPALTANNLRHRLPVLHTLRTAADHPVPGASARWADQVSQQPGALMQAPEGTGAPACRGARGGLSSVVMAAILSGEQTAPVRSVTLLDGGTGEECCRRGVPDDRKIWSARALVDPRYHEIVRQVHAAFIMAGSRFITTSNYSVTPGVGLSDRLEDLTGIAGALALEAREACARLGVAGVRICGSLPPLVESYRPDLVLPHDQGAEQYRRIARALQPSADLFLAETMSSVAEALSAVHGARAVDAHKDVWVSWTLRADGRLRSGESVDVAAGRLLGEGVSAILFNCSEPEAILKALESLQAATDLTTALRSARVRLGAYANRLAPVPEDFAMATSAAPQPMRDDMEPARYVEIAGQWAALGAELVGGCCGIGPEYIETLRRRGLHGAWS
jgi:S-methylmethionine-dependent homocysteine/selenocysteine methylase